MQNISFPTPKSTKKYTVYDNLAGVDFSQSAESVAKNRSPLLLNMMSDNGKHPVKRPGWEIVVNLESPVHNIWHTNINRKEYFLAHAGTKIYKINQTENGFSSEVLKSGVNSNTGCGFFFRNGEKDSFYILTGKEYLVLMPAEELATEIVILEVEPIDEENENYLSVGDENVLNAVYEIFKDRYKDVLTFEE